MEKHNNPFREMYEKTALPSLRTKLGRDNINDLPRIDHIIIAAGVGKQGKEGKFVDDVEKGIAMIAGQKPIRTIAKKSIAGFKLREGQVSGIKATMRGRRADDFMYKFINVTLPRVRDFRGVPAGNIDGAGNLTVGIRESLAFPEIDPQKVDTIFGLQVTIVTTARTAAEARALFEAIKFPLTDEKIEQAAILGPQKKAAKK